MTDAKQARIEAKFDSAFSDTVDDFIDEFNTLAFEYLEYNCPQYWKDAIMHHAREDIDDFPTLMLREIAQRALGEPK